MNIYVVHLITQIELACQTSAILLFLATSSSLERCKTVSYGCKFDVDALVGAINDSSVQFYMPKWNGSGFWMLLKLLKQLYRQALA